MKRNILLSSTGMLLAASTAFAEPSPPEINNYFNPRPDAYIDLDGVLNLQYRSDMPSGSSIADANLIYDQLNQDVDSELFIKGNASLSAKKSNGIGIGLGAAVGIRNYAVQSGGAVDRAGQIFSSIDSGTADPRSFWFAGAGLGFGYQEESDDDLSDFNLTIGIGRGRAYPNKSFHQAWALTEKLKESGHLSGEPTTDQLYSLAKIIDERIIHSRKAIDEAHGLGVLANIHHGKYTRLRYKEIWRYLSAQGLVSGEANLDSAFDMRYVFNDRSFFSWQGGAEITAGFEFNSKDEVDNGLNEFSSVFERLEIPDPTNSVDDDNFSIFAAYKQFWPIDIKTGISAGAKTAITDDSLLAAKFDLGYQREINDYLWLSSNANLAMAVGSDDELVGLQVDSTLVYELGPTSSLIASAYAATGTDLDFKYSADLKLSFDLM